MVMRLELPEVTVSGETVGSQGEQRRWDKGKGIGNIMNGKTVWLLRGVGS